MQLNFKYERECKIITDIEKFFQSLYDANPRVQVRLFQDAEDNIILMCINLNSVEAEGIDLDTEDPANFDEDLGWTVCPFGDWEDGEVAVYKLIAVLKSLYPNVEFSGHIEMA